MKNPINLISTAVLTAAAAITLTACAPQMASDVYYAPQTMRPQSVEMGVVEGLRPVRIQAGDSGVGTVGGAALGGLAGSTIGHGGGSVAGAIGGAILGGVIGTAVERDANRREGVEVTVRMDNGRMISLVQEAVEPLRPGDRVRVLSDGYTTRVTR
jgi:outer membrane lipoprotein SlyB